jgi:hypothetical protein
LQEPGGEKMEIAKCDCCQINYHELLLLLGTVSKLFTNLKKILAVSA